MTKARTAFSPASLCLAIALLGTLLLAALGSQKTIPTEEFRSTAQESFAIFSGKITKATEIQGGYLLYACGRGGCVSIKISSNLQRELGVDFGKIAGFGVRGEARVEKTANGNAVLILESAKSIEFYNPRAAGK